MLDLGELSISAQQAMRSTALEFSDDVNKTTDPLLLDIFKRIESGNSTFEQEESVLITQWQNMMQKRQQVNG